MPRLSRQPADKFCSACGTYRPSSAFYRRVGTKSKLQTTCSHCHNDYYTWSEFNKAYAKWCRRRGVPEVVNSYLMSRDLIYLTRGR